VFALLLPSLTLAQEESAVYEPTAGNFFVVGARTLAMGGAAIAAVNDATALIYNPAGLARITRIELGGTMTHQRTGNASQWQFSRYSFSGPHQNNTRFGSANLVLPVPTYRGSLVLALGVNRVDSFDRTMEYSQSVSYQGTDFSETAIELESGGIYVWSFGGAVDVSPNVSVGGALNLWSGKDDYTWFHEWETDIPSDTVIDDRIVDRYSGFNGKLGVRIQPNKALVLGATIESPVTLTIKEDWNARTIEDGEEIVEDYYSEYKISLPFNLGAGVAFNLNQLTLAGDLNYTDWTQTEYKKLDDVGAYNRQIKRTYRDALRVHVGAEYLIPQIGTSLRAGFYRDPLPFRSELVGKNRSFVTAGVGFLIDQVMTLDVAWAHGSWELQNFLSQGLTEKYTTDRLFVSVAYHL
jgi:long-subunit fatty acid transport protein